MEDGSWAFDSSWVDSGTQRGGILGAGAAEAGGIESCCGRAPLLVLSGPLNIQV